MSLLLLFNTVPIPVNTVAPVASGTAVVGSTLSTTNGTWTNSPSAFTYQWQRDGHGDGIFSNILGATSSSYVLVDADDACQVRVRVTASNSGGSGAPATSNVLGPVTEPVPANTVAPSISGTPTVGSLLSVTDGTWTHMGGYLPSFTYQWQRDTGSGYTNIPGETTNTYTLGAGDNGAMVRAVVTAINTGGSTAANSGAVGPITEVAPTNTTPPAVTGVVQACMTVCAAEGIWTGSPTSFTYQWQYECPAPPLPGLYPGPFTFPGPSTFPGGGGGGGLTWCDLTGETDRCLALTEAHFGMIIRVVVTASNSGGSGTADSAEAGPVTHCPPIPPPVPLNPPSSPNALGCGVYQVLVMERGGGHVLGILPVASLQWARVLDDTSEATITAQSAPVCFDLFRAIRTWQHELAIARDDELVWVGPVVKLTGSFESPQILARDVSAWWDHRQIHSDFDFPDSTDLAVSFGAIARDAMFPDNTPRVDVTTSPSGVFGAVKVLESDHETAGPRLREIADIGIDWTALQREILAGGVDVPVPSLGVVTDDWFITPPTVEIDGTSQTNRSTALGTSTDDAGATVKVTGDIADSERSAIDGLLESTQSLSDVAGQAAVDAAARTSLELSKQTIQISPALLSPAAPVRQSALIAGATARLRLSQTMIPVDAWFRLKLVQVTSDGQNAESFTVTFQPIGTA